MNTKADSIESAPATAKEIRKVVFAAALGTVFEWYDFFVYGSLAAFFGAMFFPRGNEPAAFLAVLATFGAGFVLRGWLAPTILVCLRLLQGLAVGGEFGGAVTYVAEHAPADRRGFTTGWLQITATLGLFLSLVVILVCRQSMSPEMFASWGWRIPFVLSIILLAKNPIKDTFGHMPTLRIVLLAIFGAVAGQAVVWYTGHFYSLYFLTATLKINYQSAYTYLAIALLFGAPFFVFFGWLSDKIGRKWLMMSGCLISAIVFIPIFQGLTYYGNPALYDFRAKNTIIINGGDCREDQTFIGQLFQPKVTKPCTLAKAFLSANAVPYEVRPGSPDLKITVGNQSFAS
ncbi:MAG: MFS transporter, partial [Afipia sp.]|nr:MFS transporter [Afipia sp.]